MLKPGGQFHCLEFSTVNLPVLKQLYDAYSFRVIPTLGRWVLPPSPAMPDFSPRQCLGQAILSRSYNVYMDTLATLV